MGDEPATPPRVEQLDVITKMSPWCTVVKNKLGVSLKDVFIALYKE